MLLLSHSPPHRFICILALRPLLLQHPPSPIKTNNESKSVYIKDNILLDRIYFLFCKRCSGFPFGSLVVSWLNIAYIVVGLLEGGFVIFRGFRSQDTAWTWITVQGGFPLITVILGISSAAGMPHPFTTSHMCY